MKQIFATYGDSKFNCSKERIKQEAINFGFDETYICGPEHLSNEFKEKVKDTLKYNRGGGYYVWKPFIIKYVMDKINYGDLLVYCDSGCTIQMSGKEKYNEYIKMLQKSEHKILEFNMDIHKVFQWTKKDVLDYFKITKDHEIYNKGQNIATIFMMIKTVEMELFINEYYNITINRPDLFIDSWTNDNQEGFIEHRHDQSIFCILSYLRGCITVPDTTYSTDFIKYPIPDEPFLATRIRI